MKISKKTLQKIIKEEAEALLLEGRPGCRQQLANKLADEEELKDRELGAKESRAIIDDFWYSAINNCAWEPLQKIIDADSDLKRLQKDFFHLNARSGLEADYRSAYARLVDMAKLLKGKPDAQQRLQKIAKKYKFDYLRYYDLQDKPAEVPEPPAVANAAQRNNTKLPEGNSMKMSRSKLQTIIEEEALKFLQKEGDIPGRVSGEDLTAAITVAIAEVFQEMRPDHESAAIAYASIMGSIDEIFRQSYRDSARLSKKLGAEDDKFGEPGF